MGCHMETYFTEVFKQGDCFVKKKKKEFNIFQLLCLWAPIVAFNSVQFSCSVMSDSLWPHESQHARPPCPSPTTGVHSNSCPSSWWCHPAISSSVVPFSSCPQSLPTSESFPMSQLFAWGGHSTGVGCHCLLRYIYTPMVNSCWCMTEIKPLL